MISVRRAGSHSQGSRQNCPVGSRQNCPVESRCALPCLTTVSCTWSRHLGSVSFWPLEPLSREDEKLEAEADERQAYGKKL